MAHEINQPLAAIRSYADNARDPGPARAERGRGRERLRHRPAHGPHRRPHPPAQGLRPARLAAARAGARSPRSCDNALELVERPRRGRRACRWRPSLPGPELRVLGDGPRLEQVLVNLLQNALDAVAGRPDARVTLSVAAEGAERVAVAVTRHRARHPRGGCAAQIFDAFFTTKAGRARPRARHRPRDRRGLRREPDPGRPDGGDRPAAARSSGWNSSGRPRLIRPREDAWGRRRERGRGRGDRAGRLHRRRGGGLPGQPPEPGARRLRGARPSGPPGRRWPRSWPIRPASSSPTCACPTSTGSRLFARLRAIDPELPVILITGHGDIRMAVAAMRDGAYDFLAKPYPAEALLASAPARAGAAPPRAGEPPAARPPRRGAGGGSGLPRRLARDRAPAPAWCARWRRPTSTCSCSGETGSGKEVVASALHRWSRRAASATSWR